MPTPESNDEISLLDILVVLAENFWLLLLAPVAIGAIAFGVASFLPKTYESTAILRPMTVFDEFGNASGENTATMVARLQSPELQESTAQTQSWITQQQLDARALRALLKSSISVRPDRQSGLVPITTFAPSAAQAQELARVFIAGYLTEASPRGSAREQIEQRIAVNRGALSVLNPAIEAILSVDPETGKVETDAANQPSSRPALADLVAQRTASENTISALENSLVVTMQDIVLQPPTLEENPVRPKRLQLTAIATILSGLALTVLVFIRAALRAAAHDSEGSVKITRIRKGILLR